MDNKISNNTSFGMALYMDPYKKFAKEFGEVVADEIEKARPALKKLAEDVDIFVRPSKAYFEPESENCWGVTYLYFLSCSLVTSFISILSVSSFV